MSNSVINPKAYVGLDNESNFVIQFGQKDAIVVDLNGSVTLPQNKNTVNQTVQAAFNKLLLENSILFH